MGGHSAGAILSADIGVDRAWLAEMGMPKEILKAIIPISGPYDVRARGRPGEVYTYAPPRNCGSRPVRSCTSMTRYRLR